MILVNISPTTLTYFFGAISSGSSYTVNDIDIFDVSINPQVRSDINSNLLQVSDSITNFSTVDAIDYLNRIIGLKDKNGKGITSTSISSKTGLDVNVISSASNYSTKNFYNEILSVPSSSESTLISYTVPTGKSAFLVSSNCSGTNIATYRIYVNGIVIAKQRTMFGMSLNTAFSFSADGVQLTSTDVVIVTVEHPRNYVGDFNVTLLIKEEN